MIMPDNIKPYSAYQNPILAYRDLVCSVVPVTIFATRKGNENGNDGLDIIHDKI